ncbi:hypothetical protein ACFL2Q_18575, partial [Thermodesulfobacteriota bacterium]
MYEPVPGFYEPSHALKKEPILSSIFHFLRKFTSSLSFKISFYASFTMFIVLLAFAFHSIKTQERNMTERIIQGALRDSEVIEAAIWHGMMMNDRDVIREIIKAIGTRGPFEEIDLFDGKGILRFSSHGDTSELDAKKGPESLMRDVQRDT